MRKLVCIFVMGILAGAAAFGEEASVIPKGNLRFSHDQNIGFSDDSGDGYDRLFVTTGFGLEYAPSNWLNVQALWREGGKLFPDLSAGSLFLGVKGFFLGDGSLITGRGRFNKFRVSAALGVFVPPGNAEPDLRDQDQKLWGMGFRLYGDYIVNKYVYFNAYFENVFYPPQYQSDNIDEYRNWVQHYHDYTFELEGHFRIPLRNGMVLMGGSPIRFFCAPYMNAADEYATSQYYLSLGTYLGIQFPQNGPPAEISLRYNAYVLGQNIRQVHKVSLVFKVTIPPENMKPRPKNGEAQSSEQGTVSNEE